MKRIIYILLSTIATYIIVGCQDKPEPIVVPNIISSELTFKSNADYYDINVEVNEKWNIVAYPEWVSPIEENGDSKVPISLYVEDNTGDIERCGEMVVLTDNSEIRYSLTQRSILTDDENAAIVSEKSLKKTNAVGYSVDVFKTGDKYALGSAVINPVKLIKTLAAINESDAYSVEEQYYSETESIIGNSTTAISTQLSVNAGVELEISGFKGSISGKFSTTENVNEEKAYAIRKIKHIASSRYLRPGILRTLAEHHVDSIFQTSFRKDLVKIQKNPSDISEIEDFVDKYGTHLIVSGTLGGELELAMEMTSSEKISEMDIHAALNLTHEMVNGGASFDMNDSQKEIAKNTRISLTTYGGSNVFTLTPGSTFETAMKEVEDMSKLNKWTNEVKNGESLAVIDIQTYPIYDLMPDEASKNAVREYIVNTYQNKKLGHGPLMYVVNGFDNKDAVFGYLDIPEINLRLEYHHENVPEISESALSTIIYSGPIGEMNYDCGFFIGSSEKQPGKLRRGRNGKYTYEPFSNLDCKPIEYLYVDATGLVTIACENVDNYSTRVFTYVFSSDLPNNWTSKVAYHNDRVSIIANSDNIKKATQYPYELAISWPGYGDEWTCQYLDSKLHIDNLEILCLKEKENLESLLDKITVPNYYFTELIFTPPMGTEYIQLNIDFYRSNAYCETFSDYMMTHFEFSDNPLSLYYPETVKTTPRWK